MPSRGGIGRRKSSTPKMKDCDALFSKLVRSRGRCEAQGLDTVKCGGMLQCAHIEGRRKMVLRYDLLNSLCLCAGHHRYYTDYPIAWGELVRQHFPTRYEWVQGHRNDVWDRDFKRVKRELEEALGASHDT